MRSMLSTRPARLAPLLLAATAACAAGGHRVVHPLEKPVEARLVAVYPFGFRWDEPPSRSLLLATATADAFAARGRLPVLGPADFTVFRAASDDPRAATDLPGAMAQRKLPPTAFVALRAWAERRSESTSAIVSKTGAVGHSESLVWIEHLELLDGGGSGVLLELEGRATREPGTTPDAFDPTPELTRLHGELTAQALAALEARLTGPRPPAPPVEVRWLPAAAAGWAPPGQRSHQTRLEEADILEADLQRLSLYGFLDPAATADELARRQRLPGGLQILKVEPAWADALRPGDVIVEVGDEPAWGEYALRRVAALASARRADVVLTIVRAGLRRVVRLRPP